MAEEEPDRGFLKTQGLPDLIDEVPLVGDVYSPGVVGKEHEGGGSNGGLGSVIDLHPPCPITGWGRFARELTDKIVQTGG